MHAELYCIFLFCAFFPGTKVHTFYYILQGPVTPQWLRTTALKSSIAPKLYSRYICWKAQE